MAARCLWLLALFIIGATLVSVGHSTEEPTFSQCRVHIEAAIKGIQPSEESSDDTSSTTLAEPQGAVEQEPEPVVEPPPTAEPEPVEEEPTIEEAAVEAEAPAAEEEEQQHQEAAHEEQGDDDDDHQEDEEQEAAADDHADGEAVEEATDDEEQTGQAEEEEEEEEAVEEDDQSGEEPETSEPEPEAESASPPPAEEEKEPEPEVVEEAAAAAPEPEVQEEPLSLPAEEDAAAPEPAQVAEEPAVTVEEAPAEQEAEATPVEEDNPAEGIIEEEPAERRSRDHIAKILRLGEDAETDMIRESIVLGILKDVKRVVENSVRSLENIYKYNDVSNRNFGDPEIFSKPLVLFLGPWSGGKSSIINYLLGTEFTQSALKTGAEPSATFFQILMYGETEEKLDGTQLAADWTFSGLQKFGQAFIDRLRGRRLPNKILEKVNIVEVPGILEVRKQVDRPYPFNDVVQWFIDRADVIFVVYDPTKLDTGLEHEAIFDQLKGRQTQVRVLLNKADSVTQEELLLIQNNLVWNLSPLMASPLPPTLYAGSFWSVPYKPDAPVRLLRSHEENMLQDLRDTMDSVIENTIAEARRHAVRVRNHAKMVDCYLTTFFNQKGFFGNKKAVADDIVDNPHSYHIFEGLSTLSNISRYDLPDAEVYKDFFRLHPLYEFKQLAATCTFFRGCPLDKLDTAIAYDLPELVGKYKKRLQALASGAAKDTTSKKAGH